MSLNDVGAINSVHKMSVRQPDSRQMNWQYIGITEGVKGLLRLPVNYAELQAATVGHILKSPELIIYFIIYHLDDQNVLI
jgi:hypothetical protein